MESSGVCMYLPGLIFQAMVVFYRHYIYNEETHNFSSLGKLEFHSRCLLKLNHIIFNSDVFLRSDRTLCVLSAATDGRVVLWSIPTELLVSDATGGARMTRSDTVGSGDLAQPLAVCQAHQSGVNDIAIQQGSDHTKILLLVSLFFSLHSQREVLLYFYCGR